VAIGDNGFCALKPQMNADGRGSGFCQDLASHDSLVAFVASGLVHVKIITTGRRETYRFRHPKVLRASVQLLQPPPFRPEFKHSIKAPSRSGTAGGKTDRIPKRSATHNSQLYPRPPQKSAGKARKSADFLEPLTPCCHPPPRAH
jgi:hypothetical protein